MLQASLREKETDQKSLAIQLNSDLQSFLDTFEHESHQAKEVNSSLANDSDLYIKSTDEKTKRVDIAPASKGLDFFGRKRGRQPVEASAPVAV